MDEKDFLEKLLGFIRKEGSDKSMAEHIVKHLSARDGNMKHGTCILRALAMMYGIHLNDFSQRVSLQIEFEDRILHWEFDDIHKEPFTTTILKMVGPE